ncbi:MAG: hypothetical protein CNIPEHKO_01030 [Anaerolineales bacterium]|nr:hypothetical protein [Anaerolineae bacterium]MBL8107369.1 hypothetical protein [Anaerolineales bacterium]MBV6400736.1 hypothetical protein [Anaerolineales bacterium]MCC7187135.1 hypothetical protein [Anaerolineales bacterium]HQU37604.1 hypothetical protein [Anaerolineales bacterium]
MDVERIKFERTGGFAGIRLAADFDVSDLPDDLSQTLRELLDALDFPELPAKLTSGESVPDAFTYVITVEAGKWHHTVITGDAPEDEKMQELLELLNRLARKKIKKH